MALKHARCCVAAAILGISMEEKAGLVWVLMYVFFPFCYFLLLISCVRTGAHSSPSEAAYIV
jgi:hypothetical protein